MSASASQAPSSQPATLWSTWAKVLVVLIAFVGVVLGGLFWWVGSHEEAALHALGRHDLDTAQAHLEAGLRLWPFSPSLQLTGARTARRRGDFPTAERHLAGLSRWVDSIPDVSLERRLLAVQRGDPSGIADLLSSLERKSLPDRVLILEAIAVGALANGRAAEARGVLRKLLEADPENDLALVMRGQLHSELDEEDAAVADFRRAVEIAPSSMTAHLALAQGLLRQGFTREALGHYECVRQRQPARPEMLLGLAQCRFDSNDPTEAQRLLDYLLNQHPNHPSGLAERGRLYLHQRQAETAEQLCRQALTIAPEDRDALQVLVLALKAQGRLVEAETYRDELGRIEGSQRQLNDLLPALAEAPEEPELNYQVAAACARLHRTAEARHLLGEALRLNPDHAAARRLLDELPRQAP